MASLPGLRRGSVSSQESQDPPRHGRQPPELPPRAAAAPHRPPDYQTAVRARAARTQSRDTDPARYSDDETQVSAV